MVPSDEEYAALIQHFQDSALSHKYHVIDLVEFLRFFGLRINEARQVLKTDVDVQNRVLKVRKEIAKNGKAREVPIFDDAVPLINRLLERKSLRIYGKEVRTDKLLAIGKCYGALRSACKKLGFQNFSHHTFRHLAGTKWLECGVNPKQAAAWLGHQDGGALLLRIYADARKGHAREEAAKVRWGKSPQQAEAETFTFNGVTLTKAEVEALLKRLPAADNVVALPTVTAA